MATGLEIHIFNSDLLYNEEGRTRKQSTNLFIDILDLVDTNFLTTMHLLRRWGDPDSGEERRQYRFHICAVGLGSKNQASSVKNRTRRTIFTEDESMEMCREKERIQGRSLTNLVMVPVCVHILVGIAKTNIGISCQRSV